MATEPDAEALPAYTDLFPPDIKHPNASFEDDWSCVEDGQITLKFYYFPTGKNKVIDVKTIKGIYYNKQTLTNNCFLVKQWGQAFSSCWWACDKRRNLRGKGEPHNNVILDVGEKRYKGFTVEDIERFLAVMKNVCHPDIVIKNQFPF